MIVTCAVDSVPTSTTLVSVKPDNFAALPGSRRRLHPRVRTKRACLTFILETFRIELHENGGGNSTEVFLNFFKKFS